MNPEQDARMLFGAVPVEAPRDRHWFVPDAPDGWYCAACGLPEHNRRHVSRRGRAA